MCRHYVLRVDAALTRNTKNGDARAQLSAASERIRDQLVSASQNDLVPLCVHLGHALGSNIFPKGGLRLV